MGFAIDADDDFAQMPFVTQLWCAPADLIGEVTAKLLGPAPHGLVTDDDPADGQQILDHSQVERKAKVQPDRLCDNFGRKAVAPIAGVSNVIHHTGIPRNALHPINVTVPIQPSRDEIGVTDIGVPILASNGSAAAAIVVPYLNRHGIQPRYAEVDAALRSCCREIAEGLSRPR